MKVLAGLMILEILRRAKKLRPSRIEIHDPNTGRKVIVESNRR